MRFAIAPLALDLERALRARVDGKTKPPGALGRLEDLAVQIGMVQGTLAPSVRTPALVVFAADHGIAEEGVSAYPSAVTRQMVLNFLAGGAAVNVFARGAGLRLLVVDAGVAGAPLEHAGLLDRRVAPGTRNFADEPAMTRAQCRRAAAAGAGVVDDLYRDGCNVVGFGEMGIGNTSAAASVMAHALDLPLASCVGAGTGLSEAGIAAKLAVLERARRRVDALDRRPRGFALLGECGGFEMVMMAAAMLRAAERRMLILVDGFIATAALLAAREEVPRVVDYCVYAHRSDEQGHREMLAHLGARPLLDLAMRLGEGTGVALALGLVRAAVDFLNDMASFESAGVSGPAGPS